MKDIVPWAAMRMCSARDSLCGTRKTEPEEPDSKDTTSGYICAAPSYLLDFLGVRSALASSPELALFIHFSTNKAKGEPKLKNEYQASRNKVRVHAFTRFYSSRDQGCCYEAVCKNQTSRNNLMLKLAFSSASISDAHRRLPEKLHRQVQC